MKRWLSYAVAMAVFAVCGLGLAAGQQQPRAGTVIIPPTNAHTPQDIGKRAHTNFRIFVPAAKGGKKSGPAASSGPGGEVPSSLSCVYQTWAGQITGCPINPPSGSSYNAPSGGTKVIAIVDAYDYPTAQSDFDTFSQQFGLPVSTDTCADGQQCFKTVYATGSQPGANCGWAQEEALDIEWAHAMAPYAQIILVEAASNNNSDLLNAVQVASNLVSSAGGGEVSMSWGGTEFSGESTFDSYFSGTGVTYLASSGDTGGQVIWPSASSNVISAGGTTVNRDSNGNFTGESAWSSAGGGPSQYQPVPSYQSAIYSLAQLLNGYRGTPDFSFDANPYTGVSVYDSTPCQNYSGWMVFGGTSVAAPSLAGVVNLSGNFSGNNSVQTALYQNYSALSSGGTAGNYTTPLYDVTTGSAGTYPATALWDFATGVGSDRGLGGLTASPGFSLSASSSMSVTQGSSSSETVTVNPSGGYSDQVNFSVTSTLPTGVTVSFNPNPVSSSNWASSMTVTASSTANTGNFNLTIQGTDPSDSSKTSQANVTVMVNSSGGTGDFSLGAATTTITVPVNSSSTDTITVTPSGNFTGAVTLGLSGLPSRTSSSFSVNPVSITGNGSKSSVLTISTNRRTQTGSYTLTLTATGGSLTHTLTLTLYVGTPPTPDFSLSASPSSQTVSPGSSAGYTVSVAPSGGYTGSVTLSVTNSSLPTGMTVGFSPNPVSITGTSAVSSTLTVNTTSSTPTGTYSLTISGTGTNTHTTSVTLVVGSSSGGDFSLSATPLIQTISAGGNTSYTITVTPSGSFSGSVNLTVSGLPKFANGSLSPNPVSGGASSTLSVSTNRHVASGTYALTVIGTSGSLSHSITVQLTVN